MFSKETKRWLKAIEIAKILFEDQGYHTLYLEEIENFIRREAMYSPKISEELVPIIFRVALSKKMPMTKFVNQILKDYLEENGMMEGGIQNHEPENQLDRLQRAEAESHHQKDTRPLRPPVFYEAEKR
jgi:hypothetical protein